MALVGLPGSGKTSVGRAAAAALGRPFLDFDEEIERREGCSVGRIFADRGEAYFRGLERRLTEEIRAAGEGMILAPGGGWVTVPGALELIRPPGAVIYLAVLPATALRRMGGLTSRRPLLAGADPLATLTRLFDQRAPLYAAAADAVIDTERLELQQVTASVVAWISLFGGNLVMPAG